MHAFILAGGFATRLWPLTEKRAKPLLPLAGKPIIDHLISNLPEGMPVTVSTNAAFAESFRTWVNDGHHSNVRILIEHSRSDSEKLGALGAVAQWIEQEGITDDVLLLTGDNYCGFSFRDFLSHVSPGVPLLAAHNIGDLDRARHFGIIIPAPDSLHVEAFEEKPEKPRSTLVSTGCSVIPAQYLPLIVSFAQQKPDNVGGIFEEFLRQHIPVEFRAYTDPWFDIGSFHAYLEATLALVGEQVLLGEGAEISHSSSSGSVVLGKGSRVVDCELRNVILFDDCLVENCVLEDCILDNHCRLRGVDLTRKMLREGTELWRD
ncbi:MAG: NDP-sugar synthase [Candidatus Peregrinibacteria bacterium]